MNRAVHPKLAAQSQRARPFVDGWGRDAEPRADTRLDPTRPAAPARPGRVHGSSNPCRRSTPGCPEQHSMHAFSLRVMLCVSLCFALGAVGCKPKLRAPIVTIGDLHAVHTDVLLQHTGDTAASIGGDARATNVHGRARICDGDRIQTGDDGRARLRLDDGTIVAVDRSSSLELKSGTLTLLAGRVFVQAGSEAITQVSLGDAVGAVSSSAIAFAVGSDGAAAVTVANGELVLNRAGTQTRVTTGETANIHAENISVVPEKAFDDWTGGLAAPWRSELGGFSTIPTIEGVPADTETGSPLVIRSQSVDVQFDGELALTRSETRYFNGSSSAARVPVRLALPQDAILRSVVKRTRNGAESASVAISSSPKRIPGDAPFGLEWAGGGWLRGDLQQLEAGDTLDLIVQYAQWLPTEGGKTNYRFAMDGGDEPPLIGEFAVDARVLHETSRIVSSSVATGPIDTTLHHRAADIRPTGDLVFELTNDTQLEGNARAYVQTDPNGGDPFVMIRTELPAERDASVSLALVIDTSRSIGSATLETQRAVVDAILDGLGPRDSIVAFSADQSLHPLGSPAPVPASSDAIKQIRSALATIHPAGASNLADVLEAAADRVDGAGEVESDDHGDDGAAKRASAPMVVYVGDGRPTVGEPDARSIRTRISKRAAGMPRLSAIAVGPSADRWMLAELVAGVGSVYEVADRSDAARSGALLLSDALQPVLRDVRLSLGPTVDRVYPRDAGAIRAGSTVAVVGRLRGNLPKHVRLEFRDGTRFATEVRPVNKMTLPGAADLPQRWAKTRIDEMALRDEGIEPAIALALSAQLVTPWTGWFFRSPSEDRGTLPFAQRVLELSPRADVAYGTRVAPVLTAGSTLLEPPRSFGGGVSLAQAIEFGVKRTLQKAAKSIQSCRDARSAVRPDVGRRFTIDVAIDGAGHTTRVRVHLTDTQGEDRVLQRCIEGVVRALPFIAGAAVSTRHTLVLPEARSSRRTTCSAVSKIALPLKKSVWRLRGLSVQRYLDALGACELRRWKDKREYLLALMEDVSSGQSVIAMASELDEQGQGDAATFLREQSLRRVTSFAELQELARLLRNDEPNVDDELTATYRKAKTDPERLSVLRTFESLAPHSGLVRRLKLSLLESMGKREALVAEIGALRSDAIVDAGLLAQGASALRRIGQEQAGRNTFGELVERAPKDPWTLAFVGDRLRAEGLHDEAVAAYESLSRLIPGDAGVVLRLALAHAGAGRLDVATRLLQRVTQTGGRGDDGRIGELASIVRAFLLAGARGQEPAEIEEQLQRRLLETPLPDVAGLVLVQSAPSEDPVMASIVRQDGESAPSSPDFDASGLGLAALRLERGGQSVKLVLKRVEQLGPSKPRAVRVAALVLSDDRLQSRLITRQVEVNADGKPVELTFDGEKWL